MPCHCEAGKCSCKEDCIKTGTCTCDSSCQCHQSSGKGCGKEGCECDNCQCPSGSCKCGK